MISRSFNFFLFLFVFLLIFRFKPMSNPIEIHNEEYLSFVVSLVCFLLQFLVLRRRSSLLRPHMYPPDWY